MGKSERGRRLDSAEKVIVRDLLFDMEPQIRSLEGVVVILRLLGEAQDSVEPVALATLADCCGNALSEVSLGGGCGRLGQALTVGNLSVRVGWTSLRKQALL